MEEPKDDSQDRSEGAPLPAQGEERTPPERVLIVLITPDPVVEGYFCLLIMGDKGERLYLSRRASIAELVVNLDNWMHGVIIV